MTQTKFPLYRACAFPVHLSHMALQIVSDVDASATRQSQAMAAFSTTVNPDGGTSGAVGGSSSLSAKLSAIASRLRAIETDSGEWRDSTAAALAASEIASRTFVDVLSARLVDLAGAAALAREEVTDALKTHDAALAEYSASEAERRSASTAALTAALADLVDKHAREAGRQSEVAVSKLRAGVAGAQEGVARRGRAMQDAITAVTLLGQRHVGEVAKALDVDNTNLQEKHTVPCSRTTLHMQSLSLNTITRPEYRLGALAMDICWCSPC